MKPAGQKFDTGPEMTAGERLAGIIYLPCYVALTALLIAAVARLLGFSLSVAQTNLAYFAVNFGCTLLIFGPWLRGQFSAMCDDWLRTVKWTLLGFGIYYVMITLLSIGIDAVFGEISNPNDQTVSSMLEMDPRVTLVCAVLLGPLTEETLFRGLIFGSLHKKSRALAYAVMCVGFGLIHTWQYFLADPSWTILINFLQYLPGAVALGICYERSGSIWCPVFLHMIINALAVGLSLF